MLVLRRLRLAPPHCIRELPQGSASGFLYSPPRSLIQCHPHPGDSQILSPAPPSLGTQCRTSTCLLHIAMMMFTRHPKFNMPSEPAPSTVYDLSTCYHLATRSKSRHPPNCTLKSLESPWPLSLCLIRHPAHLNILLFLFKISPGSDSSL